MSSVAEGKERAMWPVGWMGRLEGWRGRVKVVGEVSDRGGDSFGKRAMCWARRSLRFGRDGERTWDLLAGAHDFG